MMHFCLTGSHTESSVKRFGTRLARIYLLVLSMKELRIEPESNVVPQNSSLSENNRVILCGSVHIWSVTRPSLQAPAFGGSVYHQGCSLRFMRRGLISKRPIFFQGGHYSKTQLLTQLYFSCFAFVPDAAAPFPALG